ncbi:FAD/NAD(P)-binding domain-containing protein [Aulographum hederae CBS 113979]|uniref:FAD/NAD(P)-binding domain-containing protein n=1 Tax=Aulographum hederae CBS 113979 TaxID=1176131 RepID=A0A6G1HFC0_9PEZI|nr:FAD/NAD(P)-binding domain-containing protein [Aulographum hederae CBS 113979]
MNRKKKIAIVGSGVSGLGALYALRDTDYEIHLYEAADRLGGHTNTVEFSQNGHTTDVDTGFIVLNSSTYPNFISFLEEIGIEIVPTDMTFGVTRDGGAFEWAGTSLGSVFAQKKNVFSPSMWRMIFDIIRFNQFALDLLSESNYVSSWRERSIGEYLDQEGYSAKFRDDYLIPMTACVWSTGADKCALEFPAMTLVRFLWNHHLLTTVAARPPWLTLESFGKSYIDVLMKDFPQERVHLSTPVTALSNEEDGRVKLRFGKNNADVFDHVVLACHGDQATRIISCSATETENKIMGCFETTPNTVYLHSDVSLMPQRRIAWSAWNYLTSSSSPSPTANGNGSPKDSANLSPSGALSSVSLTYNMNILQHIPTSKFGDVLVTMNPPHPPEPALTQASFEYRHPLYNASVVQAQERLDEIQGTRGVYYAGAWTCYGFHEDGFASGVKVGRMLGGSVPWEVVDAKFSRGKAPVLNWKDYLLRAWIVFIQFFIVMFGSVGSVFPGGSGRKTNAKAKKLQ